MLLALFQGLLCQTVVGNLREKKSFFLQEAPFKEKEEVSRLFSGCAQAATVAAIFVF